MWNKKEIKLKTPTITKAGFGAGPDGVGIDIKVEPVGEITGVEVYASTTSNGKYEKIKSITTVYFWKRKWHKNVENVYFCKIKSDKNIKIVYF